MRLLLVLACLAMSASALAARATGEATVSFRQFGGPGHFIETDIRREGTLLLGQSTNGTQVYLETAGNVYQGRAASREMTSLTCTAAACSGIISGQSADFTIQTRVERGRTLHEGSGSINFHPYRVVRTADSVQISAGGLFTLIRVAPGVYKGTASFYRQLHPYEVTVKGSGDLTEIAEDPVLSAIFLAGPISAR